MSKDVSCIEASSLRYYLMLFSFENKATTDQNAEKFVMALYVFFSTRVCARVLKRG